MSSPKIADISPKERLIFCGTQIFAVTSLNHLLAQPDFEISSVIINTIKQINHTQEVSFSPIKKIAFTNRITVIHMQKIRAPESEQFLRKAKPDAIVIIAYGQIIPARLLNIPHLGWINLHASLLPKYRGAAPIQWAIASGETLTGVSTMRIDAGMDSGEIILQHKAPIAPSETAPQLAERLAEMGAPLIAETLRGLRDGTLTPEPQDHGEATLALLLKKEDGLIEWALPAHVIYNRMRGFTPWPGAYSSFRGTACHLTGEPVSNSDSDAATPGQILYDGKRLVVGCGQHSFFGVSHVKQEGRKQVSAVEFANGARLQPGELFGNA